MSLNDLLEIVCLNDIFLTDGQKIAIKKGSVQGVAIVGKQGGKILSWEDFLRIGKTSLG